MVLVGAGGSKSRFAAYVVRVPDDRDHQFQTIVITYSRAS